MAAATATSGLGGRERGTSVPCRSSLVPLSRPWSHCLALNVRAPPAHWPPLQVAVPLLLPPLPPRPAVPLRPPPRRRRRLRRRRRRWVGGLAGWDVPGAFQGDFRNVCWVEEKVEEMGCMGCCLPGWAGAGGMFQQICVFGGGADNNEGWEGR